MSTVDRSVESGDAVVVAAPTRAYSVGVSVAESPHGSSHLMVVTPTEALERAQPLPSDDMAVDGLTDEEGDAFKHALADR